MLYLFIFGNFPNLRGLGRARTLTLGFTIGKAKPLSGATTGGTPERPRNRQRFFEKFPYPSFSFI